MAGSMKTGVTVLAAIVVGVFGVASAVLGFIAENKRITAGDIHVSGTECVYPANPAHTMGAGAIVLLTVAQIIASVAASCCGCCRPGDGASKSSKKRRVVGVVASVLSWIMAAIAVWNYCRGVYWNTAGTRRAVVIGEDEEECFYLKGGVFIRAAVLGLVATSLAIMSCVLLRAPAATDEPEEGAGEPKPDSQNGVVVGLPQWPAQGNGPAQG